MKTRTVLLTATVLFSVAIAVIGYQQVSGQSYDSDYDAYEKTTNFPDIVVGDEVCFYFTGLAGSTYYRGMSCTIEEINGDWIKVEADSPSDFSTSTQWINMDNVAHIRVDY